MGGEEGKWEGHGRDKGGQAGAHNRRVAITARHTLHGTYVRMYAAVYISVVACYTCLRS